MPVDHHENGESLLNMETNGGTFGTMTKGAVWDRIGDGGSCSVPWIP